jgi:hypothetical protein
VREAIALYRRLKYWAGASLLAVCLDRALDELLDVPTGGAVWPAGHQLGLGEAL